MATKLMCPSDSYVLQRWGYRKPNRVGESDKKLNIMSRFGKQQYAVDSARPTRIEIDARDLAGLQIQDQFFIYNQGGREISNNHFKWIRSDFTMPSFDSFNFGYKNMVFSVLVELVNSSGISHLNPKKKEILINECLQNNLIPCLFKVVVTGSREICGDSKQNSDQRNYQLRPLKMEWNLYDARNNKEINPLALASDELVRMSKWELNNFAIQIVSSRLIKEGYKIQSYCDIINMNPQIWFENESGETAWIIVRYIDNDEDLDYRKWVGLEEVSPMLKPYDGYFAPVRFSNSTNDDGKPVFNDDVFRGCPVNVDYRGLQRVYVV